MEPILRNTKHEFSLDRSFLTSDVNYDCFNPENGTFFFFSIEVKTNKGKMKECMSGLEIKTI